MYDNPSQVGIVGTPVGVKSLARNDKPSVESIKVFEQLNEKAGSMYVRLASLRDRLVAPAPAMCTQKNERNSSGYIGCINDCSETLRDILCGIDDVLREIEEVY